MKQFLALLSILMTVTSCTISEEVIIKEDGAIEVVNEWDIPQISAMIGHLTTDEKIQMNQISNQELNYYDFIEMLSELDENNAVKFEGVDNYKEDLSKLDFVKFRLDLRDKFGVIINNKAKSIEEYNANNLVIEQTFGEIHVKEKARIEDKIAKNVKKNGKKTKKQMEEDAMLEPIFSKNPLSLMSVANYQYNGKTFSKVINHKKFVDSFELDELKDEEERSMFTSMVKQMKLKLKYTFPKKIKSIDMPDAMLTVDGKSFIKEYTLDELINDEHKGNFKVELEE